MKINAVHAAGGADLLVRTVQDFTGVIIDHYAEINMKGFLALTDAVGGVEVCLDEPLEDVYAGIDLPEGCQNLDGKEGVGFVRSRRVATEQFGADDFGRINKQQYFIRQAMAKVRSAGTLLNPLKVKAVIDAVGSNLTTDRDLGPREMLSLAGSLQNLEPSDVATRTVPGYWSPDTGFVHAYPEQAEALFQSLRDAETLPDVGTEAPAELEPKDVRVLVLNGVGTEGLASDVADFLTDKGFQVVDATNADEYDPDLQDLTIQYTAGEVARANLLQEYLGDVPVTLVEVEPGTLADGVDVVLTVGSAWQPAA
jgi:LCP family protein required for cell wall assembly